MSISERYYIFGLDSSWVREFPKRMTRYDYGIWHALSIGIRGMTYE